MSIDGGGGPEGGEGKLFSPEEIAALKKKAEDDQQAGVEEHRGHYVKDREKRADRRNLLQKLFGISKQHTEKTIAHEEALQMNRAIDQEEAGGASKGEARRRVYERPEFRLTGKVREAFDDIEAGIEHNSFGLIRERLQRPDMWEGVDPDDIADINNNYISKMVADRARTLAEEGDGKHFAASISFLHEYLSPEDFPDELRPKIYELVGQELIKKCTIDTGEDFVSFLALSHNLGIYREPTGETRKELQERALEWMNEGFKKLEDKPEEEDAYKEEYERIAPLIQLSFFMENLHLLSAEQIEGRPDLKERVEKAFVGAKSYFEANNDEQTQDDLKDLHRKLFNSEWEV